MRTWNRTRRWAIALTLAVALTLALAPTAPVSAAAQQGTSPLDRIARLDVRNVSLEEALRALQTSSGAMIAFSSSVVAPWSEVSCSCLEVAVRTALDSLLAGTRLEYVLQRRQILVGERRAPAAEVPVLHGRVREAASGRPLTAAEVYVDGGSGTVLTDPEGRFRVRDLPSDGSYTLNVRSIGYETWSGPVQAGTEGPIEVTLVPRPIPLSAMVISPGSFGILDLSPATQGTTVTRADIEAIPSFSDDVFRTLKRMPGISSDDVSSRLSVRGASDRNLLVLLDGMELYEPYHLKELDGVFGIVDVQALGGINLISGGFAADFGDRSAGVFDMQTRRAPAQGTRTTLGASLSTLSAISQGTFAGGKGQWLTSLRRGSLEYAMAVAGVADELDPRYWDALGRVQYLAGNHLIWGEVLLAGDDLDWTDDVVETSVRSTWASRYAWAGWNARLGERFEVESIVSTGLLTRDRTGTVLSPGRGIFSPLTADVDDRSDFDFHGLKQSLSVELGEAAVIRAGYDLRGATAAYDYRRESTRYALSDANQVIVVGDTSRIVTRPTGTRLGVFGSLRLRPAESLAVEIGVRLDRQTHSDDRNVSPRVLARWDPTDGTTIRASAGRYVQSQGIHELQTSDGESDFSRAEEAEQYALGIEQDLRAGLSLRVEAYTRETDHPRPLFVNLARYRDPIMEVASDRFLFTGSKGRAQGIETVLSQEATRPLAWSLSYALTRSEYKVDGAWVPTMEDQRHALNARVAWRPNRRWQLSTSWHLHTGWPLTEQFVEVEPGLSEDGTETIDVVRREFGPINASRLPTYHRLDLRISRTFEYASSALEIYLDVFNLYNRTNARGLDWDLVEDGSRFTAHREIGEEQLPVLPTIGFRWEF